jgi:hypothetical protein
MDLASKTAHSGIAFWHCFTIALAIQLALVNYLFNVPSQHKRIATAQLFNNAGVFTRVL